MATSPPSSERRRAVALAAPATGVLLGLFAVPITLLLSVSLQGPDGVGFAGFGTLFGSAHYRGAIWNSFALALWTTLACLVLAYPASFALARARGGLRSLLLACLFLPLAASVVVKTFAWTVLMRSDGLINWVLLSLGLVETPVRLIFTQTALVIGAVNVFLPFMVLPIYTVVAQLDARLPEAAATLGASPLIAFAKVTLPLTVPGVVAGIALTFSLSVSAYVVPSLLIGEKYPTLSSVVAKSFLLADEPSLGAAAGLVMLLIALAVVVLSSKLGGEGDAP
jgi:putative spermidine/putrescine transport system permease protein